MITARRPGFRPASGYHQSAILHRHVAIHLDDPGLRIHRDVRNLYSAARQCSGFCLRLARNVLSHLSNLRVPQFPAAACHVRLLLDCLSHGRVIHSSVPRAAHPMLAPLLRRAWRGRSWQLSVSKSKPRNRARPAGTTVRRPNRWSPLPV